MRAGCRHFLRILRLLIILLIGAVVFWLNHTPTKFDNLSPNRILRDKHLDFKTHCKFTFGEYVEATEKISNSCDNYRTVGSLAGYPTGNDQGTWRFFSLASKKIISRNGGTPLPTPVHVIQRVHDIADSDGQPESFIITDIHGNEFSPDDADGGGTGVTPSATPSGDFTAAPTFPAPTNDETNDTN